jgi:hypothetical protein
MAQIDFVSDPNSTFSFGKDYWVPAHGDDYNYCLALNWHITFDKTTGSSERVQLSINWPQKQDFGMRYRLLGLLTPKRLLSMLPPTPEQALRNTMPGTLDFQAPCISATSLKRVHSLKLPKDQIEFAFDGAWVLSCIVQCDPDSAESDIEDLVLILYEGIITALCIKTVNGFSRRVGVAIIFAQSYETWAEEHIWQVSPRRDYIVSKDVRYRKLDVYWKHIYLQ